jgi:hypothetical protein
MYFRKMEQIAVEMKFLKGVMGKPGEREADTRRLGEISR